MAASLDVSVVVCAYTEERWRALTTSVSSARRQTLPPREVVVVVDHNESLLQRARRELAGVDVTVVPNRFAQGLSGARNSGFAATDADVIAFLDDDAVATSAWLEELTAPLSDPAVIGTGGRVEPWWLEGRPRWFPSEFDWVVGCTYRGMAVRDGRIRNPIGASMAVRRFVLEDLGGFRTELGRRPNDPTGAGSVEETDLAIRAGQRWPRRHWSFASAAQVFHEVPAQRSTFGYFRRRCRDEGRAKAVLSAQAGAAAVASEREYARVVLPRAVGREARKAWAEKEWSGLLRAGAVVAGLAETTVAYYSARALGRGRSAAANGHRTGAELAPPPVSINGDGAPARSISSARLRPERRAAGRLLANLAVLSLIALVAVLSAAGGGGTLHLIAALAAASLVPGWAISTRLNLREPMASLGVVAALSLAVGVSTSAFLAWTGWWEPTALILGIGAAAAAAIGADAWRLTREVGLPALRLRLRLRLPDRRRALAGGVWAAPLAAGIVLWARSLDGVQIDRLGSYGLPPELPLGWWAGVGLLVVGAVLAATRVRPGRALLAGYVLALVAVLFGTIPILAEEPHYAWTYKHIGVARVIAESGGIDASLDIYNRWPGLFALTAVFGELAGVSNPTDYVKWAELFFTPLAVLMVLIAVRALVDDRRVLGLTAIFFLASNWVAQTYFAPQALAFVLGTAVLAVCLAQLGRGGAQVAPRVRRLLVRATGVAQESPTEPAAARWSRPISVAVVLSLFAVVVVSHQLTPFITLFSVAGLAAFGVLVPRWIVAAMALLVLAYLGLNLDYVRENFSVFTGVDPVENAQIARYNVAPEGGKILNAQVVKLLSLLVWVGALLAYVRLAKRGLGLRALPLLVLALAPFSVLFAQSYGGEAILRVILFSTPWCAALIAWALVTAPRQLVLRVVSVPIGILLTALFVVAFMGTAQLNVIPDDEVRASERLYAEGRPGSVVMLSAPNFPARLAANYPDFVGPQTETEPNLLRSDRFRERSLGPRDVPRVVNKMERFADHGYLVFSSTQQEFARAHGLVEPGALRDLESAIAAAPRFELFHRSENARIYRLRPPAPGRPGGSR